MFLLLLWKISTFLKCVFSTHLVFFSCRANVCSRILDSFSFYIFLLLTLREVRLLNRTERFSFRILLSSVGYASYIESTRDGSSIGWLECCHRSILWTRDKGLTCPWHFLFRTSFGLCIFFLKCKSRPHRIWHALLTWFIYDRYWLSCLRYVNSDEFNPQYSIHELNFVFSILLREHCLRWWRWNSLRKSAAMMYRQNMIRTQLCIQWQHGQTWRKFTNFDKYSILTKCYNLLQSRQYFLLFCFLFFLFTVLFNT